MGSAEKAVEKIGRAVAKPIGKVATAVLGGPPDIPAAPKALVSKRAEVAKQVEEQKADEQAKRSVSSEQQRRILGQRSLQSKELDDFTGFRRLLGKR